VAAGALSVRGALVAALVLAAAALAGAGALGRPFLLTAVAYVVLLGLYSTTLKHVVIVDVITVAAGFVLRAVGGATAIDVEISGALLICTFLIALFLALGKRRHEVLTLDAEATRHRPVLAEYTAPLLDQMIAVVTASTVTAYALYTMSAETVARFDTRLLPATLLFVLYGIFRFLYLLYRRQLGGNPSELFLNDRALLANAALWVLAVLVIIYGVPR
jgi:4-hydroxybenzoate polyprenyltransferase